MTPPAESALRDAAIRGDRKAWTCLFDSAVGQVTSYVSWRCAGRNEWIEDVNQDVWLTSAKSLGRFDPTKGPFVAWVCGLAANVIRNRIRDWKRNASRIQPLTTEISAKPNNDPTLEIAIIVATTLAELPVRYERALRAKYLDGLSVNEIAERWGETQKSVESVLTRAREAFRERFQVGAT